MAFATDAKAVTADSLIDPMSPQYRKLRYAKQPNGSEVICGDVNAKNRFGGYVGFNAFVVARDTERTNLAMPSEPRDLDSGIQCQAEKLAAITKVDAIPNVTDAQFADATKKWNAMGCDDNDPEFWSLAYGACEASTPVLDQARAR